MVLYHPIWEANTKPMKSINNYNKVQNDMRMLPNNN